MPPLLPFYYLCHNIHFEIMELLRSYYSPDHASTSLSNLWITDGTGQAIQHLHYLPFGEDWVDQRNSNWNAPYTFSGKEKDAETGYGYFGARYYDSGLSIWLSVDPMSDKYPSMSPYNYCANNPVILVDPDGREIVDADGRICYTKQDGWLSNAPDDTKRVGNAMMETETGKEQFNKMVDADTQFQIKISQDKTGTKNGDMNPTSYHSDQNGNIILESATITIFINDIDEYINGIFPPSRIWDNSEEGMLAKYVNVSQFMGAVAGHEAEHGTSQENLQMNARKDPKLEIKPDEIKIKILKEYKYKNYGL